MSEYLGSLFPPKVFISSAQKMYIWNEKKRRVERKGKWSQRRGNLGDLCIHI